MLVFRELNGRSGRRYGLSPQTRRAESAAPARTTSSSPPTGCSTPGQIFAVIAQRHMLEYGTTDKQLGQIAVTCRERANANPRAQMHDRPLTMDDYLAARMISRPLRLYDFCLETDGACAVIVTSTERARDLRQPPALIRAVAQASIPHPQPGIQFPVLMRERSPSCPPRRWPRRSTAGPVSARATSTSPSSTTASPSPC